MSKPTASADGSGRQEGEEWFPLLRALVATAWEVVVGWLLPDDAVAADSRGTMSPSAGRATVRLVAGLGNHGMGGTRHSVGMAAVARVAADLGVRWSSDRDCKGSVAVGCTGAGNEIVLLTPKLLMNVNGRSVAAAARKFGVPPEGVLLVHDDLDKPFGKLAVKHGGSARGHNGVRSCVAALKSDAMARLRIGIGRPSSRSDVTRHVLSGFTSEECAELESAVLPAATAMILELVDGAEANSKS